MNLYNSSQYHVRHHKANHVSHNFSQIGIRCYYVKTLHDAPYAPNQRKMEDRGWGPLGLDEVEIGNLVPLIILISNESSRYWKDMNVNKLTKDQMLHLCNLDHGISDNKQLSADQQHT